MIECKNLSVGYDGKPIIKELNFTVNGGEYLSVIGENGSGKSTLMKTLLGLLPAVSGSIVYNEGLNKNEIGYLPQQTVVQKDFPASVFEIVVSGFQGKCGLRPFYNKKERSAALGTLEALNMGDFKDRCYRELSGGQQQRVLLARALCATERLILLDEPVTGLDPKATKGMYELIAELNRTRKITVIMISHDMPAAIKYSSHILHIGKDVFFGTKRNFVLLNPEYSREGIGND